MAVWQSILPVMVRHIIGDLGDTEVFSDSRITTSVAVAAHLVTQEYSFTTNYVIDINSIDIAPDPVDPDTYDALAIALFTLKASCMLSLSQYQTAVRDGIEIQDGDTRISTTSGLGGWANIMTLGPCKSYQLLLDKSQQSKSMNLGKAVSSPLTHWNASGPFLITSTKNWFNDLARQI